MAASPEVSYRSVRQTFDLDVAMSGLAAMLMFVNAARAVADPAGFAIYLGLPLVAAGDAGLILVYASRALFIGLAIIALMALRQWRVLGFIALAAIVMPVGDTILTIQNGAPPGTVARHIGIAVYLVLTAILLLRERRPAGS